MLRAKESSFCSGECMHRRKQTLWIRYRTSDFPIVVSVDTFCVHVQTVQLSVLLPSKEAHLSPMEVANKLNSPRGPCNKDIFIYTLSLCFEYGYQVLIRRS